MKQLLTIICLLAVASFSYGQCNPFFEFENGTKWEITNYSASGKKQSRQVNEIKSFEQGSNGWSAVVDFKSYNKKDKLELESELGMDCENGIIKLDMSRFLPQETLQSFKDMDMQITTDNLEIPSDLKVGSQLKDATITMSGDIPMSFSTTITDRRVEAIESVTTDAGTFECHKISYTITSKSIVKIQMKGVDWLAEGVGMVKSETYNKNGKLSGTSLLTSFQ